ncbi:MAG: hypothetical protein LBD48_05375 [Treponema sp.]|jgi:hypothetical protein|nr:hypothetical protein [Treponema sp.]
MKKVIVVPFIIFLTASNTNAELIDEYGHLLEQLRHYNTMGFFIFNQDGSWQSGKFVSNDITVSLVPRDRGLFRFLDEKSGKPIYGRNAILNVRVDGLVCNIDGFPLYPLININTREQYRLFYKNNTLMVEYTGRNTIEEHDIFLYWPKTPVKDDLYGVYFYFEEIEELYDDEILSGFIELSAVDIQLTLVKMMKLISEINTKYADTIVFESGSAENTLAILRSLFTVSYMVKIEPPLVPGDISERIRFPGGIIKTGNGIMRFPDVFLPKKGPNSNPLRINSLYNFMRITVK